MRLRLRGLTVSLSYPLIAAMTAALICDNSGSTAVCFVCILLHEAGHLLVLRHYGYIPRNIRITLFDIAIDDRGQVLRGTAKELAVVLAGIISNLIFAAAAALLLFLTGEPIWELFLNSNLSLAIFNGLPIESLDGGQALFLLLSECRDTKTALKLSEVVSLVFLFPMGLLGFFLLIRSGYNFTLLLTAIYLTVNCCAHHWGSSGL